MSDYTRYDAECDAHDDRVAEVDRELRASDKDYAWRRRVVDAVYAKALRIQDQEVARKMLKRIAHLDKYVTDYLSDAVDGEYDCIAEAKDPYGYRGLRRSDFI